MTEDELLFQLYGIKGYDTDAEKSPEDTGDYSFYQYSVFYLR